MPPASKQLHFRSYTSSGAITKSDLPVVDGASLAELRNSLVALKLIQESDTFLATGNLPLNRSSETALTWDDIVQVGHGQSRHQSKSLIRAAERSHRAPLIERRADRNRQAGNRSPGSSDAQSQYPLLNPNKYTLLNHLTGKASCPCWNVLHREEHA